MNADVWDGARQRIYMQEVGPRDGLQVEQRFVETDEKISLVNALSDAGLAKIEVTSFVSPKAIPQLRDAEIVLREIRRVPGVVPKLLGTPGTVRSPAPHLGDDTDAVLSEIGFSASDIAALRGRKVVA